MIRGPPLLFGLRLWASVCLSEYFLSLLALGLVLARLGSLSPVDADDVIVCHCSNAPARRSFRCEQIALTLGEVQK